MLSTLAKEELPARAAHLGRKLLTDLRAVSRDAQIVREVRGLGLMTGIELRQRVTPILKALMERGVLALPAGQTVLRLLPPLVIQEEELATVVAAIGDALREVADARGD